MPRPTFRIGAVPVTVEPSFFAVVALFGFVVPRLDAALLWIAIATVSVLVHELGHAVAFRAYGSPAAIRLHGFGGLTTGTRLPPRENLIVSLAGPLAGLVLLGLPALALTRTDLMADSESTAALAVSFAVLVNVLWSLVNLVPVLPLDGGVALVSLMELATGRDEERTARYVSIGFAVLAAAIAIWLGAVIVLVLAGAAIAMNIAGLRAERADSWRQTVGEAQQCLANGDSWGAVQRAEPVVVGAPDVEERARAVDVQVWSWLLAGDRANMHLALARRPPGRPRPATLQAAMSLLDGDRPRGVSIMAFGLLHEPASPEHLFAVEAVVRSGCVRPLIDELLAVERGEGVEAAEAVATILHHRGHFLEAAAVGSRLYGDGRADQAIWAYNAACSLTRSGHLDDAVAWLDVAVRAGWCDEQRLASDPDLAALRLRPDFEVLERTMIAERGRQ